MELCQPTDLQTTDLYSLAYPVQGLSELGTLSAISCLTVLHSLTSAAAVAAAAVLTKTQTKPAGQLQSLAPVERDGMTKNKECLGKQLNVQVRPMQQTKIWQPSGSLTPSSFSLLEVQSEAP